MRRSIRNAFLLGMVVGLVAALVRALRAEGSSSGAVGTGPAPLPRPTPALRAATAPVDSTVVDVGSALDAPAVEVIAPVSADPLPEAAPTADPEAGTLVGTDHEPAEARVWVAPIGGACPDGFPIKAKVGSRIFHVPDGGFYGRTVPDRCYPTAAAAEADGFRASKR